MVLVALAVHASCVLLFGLFVLALIDAAPPRWFAVFDALGPTFKPWLMGAAVIVAIVPALGLAALVLKALKLPQHRN